MRRFGPQGRGQGHVFVKLVRQTERRWLDWGESIETWTQQAKALLHQDPELGEAPRPRWRRDLEAASEAPRQVVNRSSAKLTL